MAMPIEPDTKIIYVTINDSSLHVWLADGRKLAVLLEWFPRLRDATPKQRDHWKLIGSEEEIHWPDLGEKIPLDLLLRAGMPPQPLPPNQTPGDASSEALPPLASIIREFFIDFLSSLVPGFLFTMFAIPPAIWTVMFLSQGDFVCSAQDDFFWHIPGEPLRYLLVCLTLVVSYVLGCVFSRRDPKVPDQMSAALLLRKDWNGRSRAVIRENTERPIKENAFFSYLANHLSWFSLDRMRTRLASEDGEKFQRSYLYEHLLSRIDRYRITRALARGDGGQFPYSHLYEYLSARELHYLAERVPWRGSDPDINARSKMFINVLKVRLQYSNQRHCGDIIRNEAHIRMMSSVWYAAQQLQKVSLSLFILLFTVSLFKHAVRTTEFMALSVLLGALFLAALWLRRIIITFLHYQRVREIVYVMETAYTAWMDGNETIFAGLAYIPPPKTNRQTP
jgi:hypothetical protein